MAERSGDQGRCGGCFTELPPAAVVCPACLRLVHAEELSRLAALAQEREGAGDGPSALDAWSRALVLLPQGTRQFDTIRATVVRLAALHPPQGPSRAPPWLRWLGPVGVLLFGAWKVIGVGKLASVLSLVAFFGVYVTELGWKFAAGFVVSIYVHELGHVAALRMAGIPASAPMFIPGVGAFVRMHAAPKDARTDAMVGLAGPLAGLAAALAAWALWLATGEPVLLAVAHSGAVINIFNLAPVWQLDGARGFAPLARWQRLAILGVAGAALALTGERMLFVVLLFGAFQAFSPAAPREPDRRTLAVFALLVAALSWLSLAARGL